jgi:hypothetical protein
MSTRRDFLKKTIMGAAALPFASLCLEKAAADPSCRRRTVTGN